MYVYICVYAGSHGRPSSFLSPLSPARLYAPHRRFLSVSVYRYSRISICIYSPIRMCTARWPTYSLSHIPARELRACMHLSLIVRRGKTGFTSRARGLRGEKQQQQQPEKSISRTVRRYCCSDAARHAQSRLLYESSVCVRIYVRISIYTCTCYSQSTLHAECRTYSYTSPPIGSLLKFNQSAGKSTSSERIRHSACNVDCL